MGPMRVLAIDVGFAASGLAVMESRLKCVPEWTGQPVYPQLSDAVEWSPIELACIRTLPTTNKKHLYRAEADVERVSQMARGIRGIIRKHGIQRIVAEVPHAGAQNYNACRSMSLATGMLVGIIESHDLAAEYYQPRQTRYAACQKYDPTKREVVDAMTRLYPKLAEVRLAVDRENIADALATFEAAKSGVLLRL